MSPVAHDLALSVERFDVDRDGEKISVCCQTASLRVDGKVAGGAVEPMRDRDRRDIEKNIAKKVLRTAKFPEARFEGTYTAGQVTGTLHLVGRAVEVSFPATEADGRVRGRVELTPTRWGIEPFKALMGAIALEDRVVVEFDVPG